MAESYCSGDGVIHSADYTIWTNNYNPPPSPSMAVLSPVPEPSTFALAGMGAFGLIACKLRRRRASR